MIVAGFGLRNLAGERKLNLRLQVNFTTNWSFLRQSQQLWHALMEWRQGDAVAFGAIQIIVGHG